MVIGRIICFVSITLPSTNKEAGTYPVLASKFKLPFLCKIFFLEYFSCLIGYYYLGDVYSVVGAVLCFASDLLQTNK